ncbi:MAG: hypothetical protein ACOX66_08110 [Oscillospiraceae bacterium]|jgi:hypothetical protein
MKKRSIRVVCVFQKDGVALEELLRGVCREWLRAELEAKPAGSVSFGEGRAEEKRIDGNSVK